MARNDAQNGMLYLLVNTYDHHVISHGISFQDFIQSLQKPLENILLLKHKFNDSEYHFHTRLEYVTKDQIGKLSRTNVKQFGDFCWIDFEDVFSLDTIESQELAELLYLGHMKRHLSPPFFQKLNNRFAYLTNNDGWMNKIYFRNWTDFYESMGSIVAKKTSDAGKDRLLGGFRKKKQYPAVDKRILQQLNSLLTEGLAISFQSMKQARGYISIPFWIIGDYVDMEEMKDQFEEKSRKFPAGEINFNKKTRDWSIQVMER